MPSATSKSKKFGSPKRTVSPFDDGKLDSQVPTLTGSAQPFVDGKLDA
jgi:hypothetical protein